MVHNELLGLLAVESQVVGTTPTGAVIVICKLDNGFRTINRCAVIGEDGVED